jgi:hypothetical protein
MRSIQPYWSLILVFLVFTSSAFADDGLSVNLAQRSQHQDVTEITFDGLVTPEKVSKFIDDNKYSTAKTLVLASLGGDVESAIKLGNWIFDKKLDVKVVLCFSACANYLFPSGRKKYLTDHSILLWHGGMHEKGFREDYLVHLNRVKKIARFGIHTMSLKKRDDFLREKKSWAVYKRIRDLEDKFVTRVGVNEYLFRLGQEPVMFEPDCWGATVPVLEKLGIKNISVDGDLFGTLAGINVSPIANALCKGPPTSFSLDAAGRFVPNH